MSNILHTKEITHLATLGIPKGMKNSIPILFLLPPDVEFLIRNENVTSEEHKSEDRLKISHTKSELYVLKLCW